MKVTLKVDFNIKIVVKTVLALTLNSGFKINLKHTLNVIIVLTLLSTVYLKGAVFLQNVNVMVSNEA